jgi:hypothetical protein
MNKPNEVLMEDLAILITDKNLEIQSDRAGGFRLYRRWAHLNEYLGDYRSMAEIWEAAQTVPSA